MIWNFKAKGPTGKEIVTRCLVDTGATFTCLHPDLLKDLEFKPTGHVGMSTANGNVRDMIGDLQIASWLTWDKKTNKLENPTDFFTIKVVNGPNLLGADFIKAAKLVIDLTNERLLKLSSITVRPS